MKTSIVIPANNESGHILNVFKGIRKENAEIPIVVVDDGSSDDTWAKLNEINDNKLIILRHRVNLGKGAAMKTGAQYSFNNGFDSVIFMDADGQHSPEDLQKFIDKLNENDYDVIFGVREEAKDVPIVRGFGNKIGIVIVYLLFGIKVSDLLCGYRAINRSAWEEMSLLSTGYGIETEMVAKTAVLKLNYTQVIVRTIYHDKTKGVTILHAFAILIDVIRWRLSL